MTFRNQWTISKDSQESFGVLCIPILARWWKMSGVVLVLTWDGLGEIFEASSVRSTAAADLAD
jgi:hypothetical protein